MSEPQVMYRAFFNFGSLSMWHTDSPVPSFTCSMHLTPCGQYVELRRQRLDGQGYETIREDMNDYWKPTKAEALAVVAPRLRAIGERMIRQAHELEENAARHAIA